MRSCVTELKKTWVPPAHPVVAWDEKGMMRGKEKENRMPIVIQGDERSPHHIGSFALENGKAITVANTVVQECKKWGIGEIRVEEEGERRGGGIEGAEVESGESVEGAASAEITAGGSGVGPGGTAEGDGSGREVKRMVQPVGTLWDTTAANSG